MKCVVITPVGPGHEALAKECQATVERAWAADPGNFTEMEHLLVDDTRGLLGRSEARNRAVLRALERGAEWIFFLDADDGLLPGAFRSVAPFLGQYDAVWGSIIEMFPGQTAFEFRVPQILTLGAFTEVLLHDPYHTLQMGHFVRASVAARYPFHKGMNTGEDFDYYLRLWENHYCTKVHEALARPATIPRARVAETRQKRFPIINTTNAGTKSSLIHPLLCRHSQPTPHATVLASHAGLPIQTIHCSRG